MRKSLLEANPHLKDPQRRKLLLRRSMISSFAIEGIVVEETDANPMSKHDEPFTAVTTPQL